MALGWEDSDMEHLGLSIIQMEPLTQDLGHSIVPMAPLADSLIHQAMCTKGNGSTTEPMDTVSTSVLPLVAVSKVNGLMTCKRVRGQRSGKTALVMRVASNVAKRKELVINFGRMAQSSLGSGEATRFKALEDRSGLTAAVMLESFLRI